MIEETTPGDTIELKYPDFKNCLLCNSPMNFRIVGGLYMGFKEDKPVSTNDNAVVRMTCPSCGLKFREFELSTESICDAIKVWNTRFEPFPSWLRDRIEERINHCYRVGGDAHSNDARLLKWVLSLSDDL